MGALDTNLMFSTTQHAKAIVNGGQWTLVMRASIVTIIIVTYLPT